MFSNNRFSEEPFDVPPERQAHYSFGAVVKEGMVYANVSYMDKIGVQMMWPYELHPYMQTLVGQMGDLIEGARVHYETTLEAKDIDKDLDELFKDGEDPTP